MICDCYEPFTKTQLLKEEVELEEVVSRPSSQNTICEMVEWARYTVRFRRYDDNKTVYHKGTDTTRCKLLWQRVKSRHIFYT